MQDVTPRSRLEQGLIGWIFGAFSLRQILVFGLLILGVVPLSAMVLISYFRSQTVLRDSVNSELQSVAKLTEDRVQRWMIARESDAKTYAKLQVATGDSEDALDLGLEVLVDPANEGTTKATTAERAAREGIQDILDATGKIYSGIYLTDTAGKIRFGIKNRNIAGDTSEGRRLEGTSFPSEFIQSAFYRSPISAYGEPFNVTTIFLAHEVIDASSNTRVGFIVLEINPDELSALVEGFADGDGLTYLQSGDFLVTHDDIIPLPEDVQGIRGPQDAPGMDEMRGFNGDTVLGSWETNPELGYVVYTQIPTDTALREVNSLGRLLGGIAVVFILLILVVSLIFAYGFTRPMHSLTEAARDIAEGSLDTRVADLGSAELGALASAFNEMTDNLRMRVQDEKNNREYLEDVLNSYMKFVERVSRGDLTSRLSLNGQTGPNLIMANVSTDRDDNLLRLGYNLNRMVEALHSMASQSRDVARSLSSSAGEILETSNRQIASATQQDASVTQTTSTVAELRATVAETAERAQMVSEMAQQSVDISRQGQRAVSETIEGMNVIRSRVESIAQNILMLSERTTQIGDIIATVNAIADQSKMLALNASIEAARAGEEGRGFAVVAMEVRNLAEQSREATAQVRDILSEIQQATNTAVMVTEEGTKGVDIGVQLVDRAGRAIRELAGKLEEAAQVAMQIAASTRQQSLGMDQLTGAMHTIKSATSTTSTVMQQSARSAKELNEMARQMESAISAYKL